MYARILGQRVGHKDLHLPVEKIEIVKVQDFTVLFVMLLILISRFWGLLGLYGQMCVTYFITVMLSRSI